MPRLCFGTRNFNPHWQCCLAALPRRAIGCELPGEVAERLKAPHSKCGIGASLSGVRIPPSPPDYRSPPSATIRNMLEFQLFDG